MTLTELKTGIEKILPQEGRPLLTREQEVNRIVVFFLNNFMIDFLKYCEKEGYDNTDITTSLANYFLDEELKK